MFAIVRRCYVSRSDSVQFRGNCLPRQPRAGRQQPAPRRKEIILCNFVRRARVSHNFRPGRTVTVGDEQWDNSVLPLQNQSVNQSSRLKGKQTGNRNNWGIPFRRRRSGARCHMAGAGHQTRTAHIFGRPDVPAARRTLSERTHPNANSFRPVKPPTTNSVFTLL